MNEASDGTAMPQAAKLRDARRREQLSCAEIPRFPEAIEKNSSCSDIEQNHVHLVHHVHRDNDATTEADLERYVAEVDDLIAQAKDNPGIYASSSFIGAVKLIRELDEASWYRIRVKIKSEKPSGVLLSDIDKATIPSTSSSAQSGMMASLMDLVEGQCNEWFYDERTRSGYVTISSEEVSRTLKVRSEAFCDWLSFSFYKEIGVPASETMIKQVVSAVEGLCKFEGKPERVFIRAGRHKESGAYYLFIGDEKRRAIEITLTGWRILEQYPVKFWMPNSSKALCVPVHGGNVERLWEFANIPEKERPLVLAWIIEAYRIDLPFPVLELNGVQGSAKSNTQRRIRSLIDPSGSMLRQSPECVENVFIGGGNNWLLSYENVSYLKPAIQDALCIVATSGGYAKRGLYTNSEEVVIEVMRPIVLNGIPNSITAQDLVDRSIHVELPEISNKRREEEMDAEFEAALPEILGGILDLFVKTLAFLPLIKLQYPPRMVDFTVLGEAMMQSQGSQPGVFTNLFIENRRESILRAIESSPVSTAILALTENCQNDLVYEGNYSLLLDRLLAYKRDSEGWPKSEKGLANQIKRQLPALRELGIIITCDRGHKSSKHGYIISIRKGEHGEPNEHKNNNSESIGKEVAARSLFKGKVKELT